MGPAQYVFDKKYPHHYSFKVLDKDGELLWRESFQNIGEAQANIPDGMKIDWGTCINQVDLNQVKTNINRKKIDKLLGVNDEDDEDVE